MTRVAVADTKFGRGVAPPGTLARYGREKKPRPHTFDWREEPGSDANSAGVRADMRVTTLEDALHRTYRSDAHMVSYVLVQPDGTLAERQPRVRKIGLPWMLEQGYHLEHDVIYADVDNPMHQAWTPRLRERFDELWASAEVLDTAGVYLTRSGYRLIQPLDEPIVSSDLERYLAAWLDELAEAGIHADPACVDWTRMMRLPHVRRGSQYESPLVDLSRLFPRLIVPKGSRRPPAGVPSEGLAA